MAQRLHQVLISPLIGGAGLVAIRLAASTRRQGISTRAWVPGPGPASEALEAASVDWRQYDLEGMRGSARGRHLMACARMIPGLLGAQRPLVHVHNPVVYRYLRPALGAARARVVVHFQIEPSEEEIAWTLAHPPDHVIACARFIAAKIEAWLGPSRRVPVTAVPNAVDLERYTPGDRAAARARLGLQTDRPVVVMLANLAPHKGQETVLKALHILKTRGVAAECWLAGEDRSSGREYEATLRSLTAALGIGGEVRFLGFRSDGPDLLRAADAFALPSTHEGLPLSLLEAQAARVPVVASPIPGILEVVSDGVTGLIGRADDPAAYADHLQRIFQDRAFTSSVVAAAAAQVRQEYGWDSLEARVFQIYRTLLDQPQSGPVVRQLT